MTISRVVQGIPEFVSSIIVIDDCSPDQTSAVVSSLNDPRVKLVKHDANQGVGGAVLTGYQSALDAGAEIIVKMDSDNQMDPQYIEKLIKPILDKQADFSKGNRFLYEKELAAMPYIRRLGNLGLSFLTKLASGYWNIFDPTNGFTAISAQVIPWLQKKRISKRYFFEISMLVELGMLRARVVDVDIPAVYNGEVSSLSVWRSLFGFPPRLLRAFFRRIIYTYFLRDFTAVSLLLASGFIMLIFGVVWGTVNWIASSLHGIPASTGTVMVAAMPVLIGVEFILQAIVLDIQNNPNNDR